jgi:Zn ribbon nucleic-acid-binding protein
MSEPYGTMDGLCPKCQSADIAPGDEGSWPECMDCGFTFYDEDTLALQREVIREQAQARAIFGRIPSYGEWKDFIRSGVKND